VVCYKSDAFFNMYKNGVWLVHLKMLDNHQFGMKVKQLCKKQFNTGDLVCTTKCPSNSKTTLNIADLVKYFNSINVLFE
jgi:hypothetical protein